MWNYLSKKVTERREGSTQDEVHTDDIGLDGRLNGLSLITMLIAPVVPKSGRNCKGFETLIFNGAARCLKVYYNKQSMLICVLHGKSINKVACITEGRITW